MIQSIRFAFTQNTMNTILLEKIEKSFTKKIVKFQVGDTIAVHSVVREGDKQRTQIFKGIVIAIKNSGLRQTFTIRKISNGVGVEKIIPMHSPNIAKIEIVRTGKVRRSKLYFMRDRIGKRAMRIEDEERELVADDEDQPIDEQPEVEAKQENKPDQEQVEENDKAEPADTK